MIPRVVIPPPFGNYIKIPNSVRVYGSYTASERPGLWRHTLRTLRPVRGGWRNAVGLRNPGIKAIEEFEPEPFYSVAPIEPDDYSIFYHSIPYGTNVELNVGCPNAGVAQPCLTWLKNFVTKFNTVSLKLPPTKSAYSIMGMAYAAGIRVFHLCNTFPTERGGLSGAPLREHSLSMCRWVNVHLPEVHIIGGGGIYFPEHVEAYRQAGASSFSLGTIWFTPWRVPAALQTIQAG